LDGAQEVTGDLQLDHAETVGRCGFIFSNRCWRGPTRGGVDGACISN